ncbi:uncharacterized protein B0H18DRAFT_957871 [Fomitopsis serialis]|uniref:uncharacterized protein n=1 Tax=Fomitopsis serialis TaxID=139415 RepID=UPI0020085C2A|nr:uncharacterized protein B0H18DRAFT_957871 [Neoantrodia serialis]KAH9918612.1 hypothetical protein B0H18DRAFT_957871 [Neoantrodia serialis]
MLSEPSDVYARNTVPSLTHWLRHCYAADLNQLENPILCKHYAMYDILWHRSDDRTLPPVSMDPGRRMIVSALLVGGGDVATRESDTIEVYYATFITHSSRLTLCSANLVANYKGRSRTQYPHTTVPL